MLTSSTLYEIRFVEASDKSLPDDVSTALSHVQKTLATYEFEEVEKSSASALAFPLTNILYRGRYHKRTVLVTVMQDLITIDFNEYGTVEDSSSFNQLATKIQIDLSAQLPQCEINRTTPLVRGREYWQYADFSDKRIREFDFNKILFDKKSQYQRVTIARSKMFDNMLLLDGVDNISERDDLYTPALLGIKHDFDYKDKTILILGGGDGAALNYLRKLSPKMVTMVEIDDVVIQACKSHLRGCCGDTLDNYSGENYEIIVGDCMDYLKQYADEGLKFDYVISDITDFPIEEKIEDKENKNLQVFFSDVSSTGAKFFREVFNRSLRVLRKDGTILTHVCASDNSIGLKNFTHEVNNLDESLTVNIEHEFMPAFGERWSFCQLKRAATS